MPGAFPRTARSPGQPLVRTSQKRPSMALIAIGVFLLVLASGAMAFRFVDQPASAPEARSEATDGRS